MNSQPPPVPQPPYQVPDNQIRDRRVYFEQLTRVLLSSGVDPDDVGRLVAELDHHVAMSGLHPVDELGPAGEVAVALIETAQTRHPWRIFMRSAVVGAVIGFAFSLLYSFISPLRAPGENLIGVNLAAFSMVVAGGYTLIWGMGSSTLSGQRTFERPSWKIMVPFALFAGLVSAATVNLEWTVSSSTAILLTAVVVPLAVALGIWSYRQDRVTVPGNARHLRRLGWGWMGR